MAYPVIESSTRLICFLRPTYALAQATAAQDSSKFSAVNRDLAADVETGYYLPAVGAAVADPPRTAAQNRAAVLSDVCAYADGLIDLLNPAWYLRTLDIASGDADESDTDKQRYRITRIRIVSACAAVQSAARASWSDARMNGLAAAQRGLMPNDRAALRDFFRGHTAAAWAAVGAGKNVRAAFSANSDNIDTAPPLANADLAAPTLWSGPANKTLSVTFDRTADPQDFNTV